MRDPDSLNRDARVHRVRTGPLASTEAMGCAGLFILDGPRGKLQVMASTGLGWEHVSVVPVRGSRVPSWEEMSFVKDVFWRPDEWVVEYHPPADQFVNNHRYVLHLWKPTEEKMPHPPSALVGVKGVQLV